MTPLSKFDIVFISYDEPNAEENWADLLNKAPWAKRVHGVKGFDAAHKEAAKLAKTDRFITVDGDSQIKPEILDYTIDESRYDDESVLSFSSKNNTNGLIYGNGGLKCWPTDLVLKMKTHESAESETSAVDFCWEINYKQFNVLSSISYQNGSAYQSFRSGFREGVKMSLDRGLRVRPEKFKNDIFPGNYRRLLIWCSVGKDVEHGQMSIYGARLGAYLTICTDWSIHNIRDYDWFKDYWLSKNWIEEEKYHSTELKTKLQKMVDIKISDLDSEQSVFFKETYVNELRYDI